MPEDEQTLVQSPSTRPTRQLCQCCERRVARRGDILCSRCNMPMLQAKLRDVVPGETKPIVEKPAMLAANTAASLGITPVPLAPPPPPVGLDPVQGKLYNRQQVSEMLGLSRNTLARWEERGYIDPPIRYIHSMQCFYSEAHIERIKKFMETERPAPAVRPRVIEHAIDCESFQQLPCTCGAEQRAEVEKIAQRPARGTFSGPGLSKGSKRLEKIVSRAVNFGGKKLL